MVSRRQQLPSVEDKREKPKRALRAEISMLRGDERANSIQERKGYKRNHETTGYAVTASDARTHSFAVV